MKVLIAGDFCPRDRVALKIEKGDTTDLFGSIKGAVASADYAIVNFECVVVDGEAKPIAKCGPNLMCTPKSVDVLKEAGFSCLTLANNHFRDYGDEGVLASLQSFKEKGLDYVGGGKNIAEAETVLYKKFDDGKLAVINVCENEFSIANQSRAGSAPLDAVKVYHRIIEARNQADYVLVIVHGGHEHYQLPSPRMKELYCFFIEVGADAVVNHHQHCYSGFEVYNGKPIVYGLGNFLFDHPQKRAGIWNEGYLAVLNFAELGIGLEILPYVQCDETPDVRPMSPDKKEVFEACIQRLNAIIADNEQLSGSMEAYVRSRRSSIMSVFTPYSNRYLRAAASRHWIPYMLSKNKVLDMIDYISCEAQRDITLGYLEEFADTK